VTGDSVRQFYDERGWQPVDAETYVDTQLYGDHRPFVMAYIARTKARVAAVLAPTGRLFLDLGCGARPEMALSSAYARHVCVDFSLAGLSEARRKLGERGLYVMADVTALPFAPHQFDAVVSSHVIYHIPGQANQARAFREVHRMIAPGRAAAVLYANPYHVRYLDLTWGWKEAFHNARRLLGDLAARLRGRPHWAADRPGEEIVPAGELFYKAYPPPWVKRFLPPGATEIRCLGWLTRPFTRRWCRDTAFWRGFLRAVAWLEDRLPHLLAAGANYVLVVIRARDEARR
jgi:SAM-dependent methyltransferase